MRVSIIMFVYYTDLQIGVISISIMLQLLFFFSFSFSFATMCVCELGCFHYVMNCTYPFVGNCLLRLTAQSEQVIYV